VAERLVTRASCAGVLVSLVYSLLRTLLDVIATNHGDHARLQAEVLALRRQVQVLERQIKGVQWTPGDRMLMAALRDRLPQSAWAARLVRPETVLGWHRALVRRKWSTSADRVTTTVIDLTARWICKRRFPADQSRMASLLLARFSADFITPTRGRHEAMHFCRPTTLSGVFTSDRSAG